MPKIQSIKTVKPEFQDVKSWYDAHLSPQTIDHNDQDVYKYVYHEGRFPSVFQLTSQGAQRFFMKAKPTNIIDIAALTSVYRPGPLASGVDKLWLQCAETPFEWGHPLVNETLKATRGLLVFQEGVMALANKVGGFPMDRTDEIRRAIMKRNADINASEKDKAKQMEEDFVKGAIKNGLSENIARDVYKKILLMSGYSFNAAHSLGYAFISYYCAYMLYHFRQYYLTAYLESMSGNDDDKATAFSEIKRMGYKLVPIDINYATKGWTYIPDKQFMPSLCSIAGLGTTAAEEIIASRPYKSFEDVLWDEEGKWKPSKFNRRALEALINVCAFDSLDCVGEDKLFSSYAHMYHVVIENNDAIKKTTKKEPHKGRTEFYRLCRETRDITPWTRRELTLKYIDCFGSLDVNSLIDPEVLQIFENKGIKPIDQYEEQGVYWFCVIKTVPKKTKNGKLYSQLEMQGLNGKILKAFCWGVKPNDVSLEDFSICFAEFSKSDFGFATQRYKIRVVE